MFQKGDVVRIELKHGREPSDAEKDGCYVAGDLAVVQYEQVIDGRTSAVLSVIRTGKGFQAPIQSTWSNGIAAGLNALLIKVENEDGK